MVILIIILIIVATPFIVALFIKKSYVIQREIVIERDPHTVFEFVRLIKNQDQYHKWVMMDPNSKREFTGTDGTVGFIATWDSTNKRVGAGSQEIKTIRQDERIDLEIRFLRPMTGMAEANMIARPSGNGQTLLTWTLSSSMKYPMNIFLVIANIEKMLGAQLQESLVNLKRVLESN